MTISVAGLGCGGFSRLGLATGKSEDEAIRLVREAVDMGINIIDTAPAYGTEPTVGKALKSRPRDSVFVATKASVRRSGELHTPGQLVDSLENSLRDLGTDCVDVFQLHGVATWDYAYAKETLAPMYPAM